ncbi:MAG: MarR family transcriptional regulator [Eubacteriales bacterium]|nr:MarR family transcriptional regulator [Eubacteriales bacterium]
MAGISEELLEAWLVMSSCVINRRLTSKLSYNEAMVCHLLYVQKMTEPETYLTATDLCRETRMLKSLMNSTLNSLEKRGVVERIRSTADRRQVYVRLCEEHMGVYREEHEHVMRIVDSVVRDIGEEECRRIIPTLHKIAQSVNEATENLK